MVKHINFDHSNPDISKDLFEWGERVQNETKIPFSDELGGFWVISRFDDISSILMQPETFICSEGITLPKMHSPVPVIPLESDPPIHFHYRKPLLPFLSPKAVKEYDGKIRTIISDALDDLIESGGGDAVADFAARIPTTAMAFVFGFTIEDARLFDYHFSEVVNAQGTGDKQIQDKATGGFKSFLAEKLEEQRANPTEGNIVSALLKHEIDGRKLTETELLGLLWSTAGGAIDTTKHSIGHAIYQLGTNPHIREQLIQDKSLIPLAVEESLRLNAASFMTSRVVKEDITFEGVDMKKDDRVLIVNGWANRDKLKHDFPNEMRLDRKPNKHLSFGFGAHQCAGMHLARRELNIALEELLTRIPNYELVNPKQHPILRGGLMWAFDQLPIRIPQ